MGAWKEIRCNRKDIQLYPMLLGGQSFRWTSPETDKYIGVFKGAVWHLKQSDDIIQYKVDCGNTKKSNGVSDEKLISQYLRLDVHLSELYNQWSEADLHFKESATKFYGIRMLNQDLIENIFSFICSSNNNIKRISSMVEKLCTSYGLPITTVDGKKYHSFPDVEALSDPKVELKLREAGFGYRAPFIVGSAQQICSENATNWVDTVKGLPYLDAKAELMKLPGVGPKVADCICLMSLSHLEAIPVDTHVFQIACDRYLPHLKGKKSVTAGIYKEIGDHFRELFGSYAGWAHTVLFCADLKNLEQKPVKSSKKRKLSDC